MPRADWRGAQVIGSGGTFTNLAGMHLARRGMLAARNVHETVVPRVDVEHILDTLAAMSTEERRACRASNPERADIIVAGIAVAAEVLGRLESREITVSRYGIREGLLLELARVTPIPARRARAIGARVRRAMCHYEEGHATEVVASALRLFDAIGERIGCVPDDGAKLPMPRCCTTSAITSTTTARETVHLIVHAELLGIAPDEQVVIANVTRYHRGGPRAASVPTSESSTSRCANASSGCRQSCGVADGLDRGHVGAVGDVRVRWLERAIRRPIPGAERGDVPARCYGAHTGSRDRSPSLAGVPVEIVGPERSVLSSDECAADDE